MSVDMNRPMTVGEIVDRDGPCSLMVRVVDLAEAAGRIPVGVWDVPDLPDGWRVLINGSDEVVGNVPPFSAMVWHGGFPLVVFDAAGGRVLAGREDEIHALLQERTERYQKARQ